MNNQLDIKKDNNEYNVLIESKEILENILIDEFSDFINYKKSIRFYLIQQNIKLKQSLNKEIIKKKNFNHFKNSSNCKINVFEKSQFSQKNITEEIIQLENLNNLRIPRGIFCYPLESVVRADDLHIVNFIPNFSSLEKFQNVIETTKAYLDEWFDEIPHNLDDTEKVANPEFVALVIFKALFSVSQKIKNVTQEFVVNLLDIFSSIINKNLSTVFKIYQIYLKKICAVQSESEKNYLFNFPEIQKKYKNFNNLNLNSNLENVNNENKNMIKKIIENDNKKIGGENYINEIEGVNNFRNVFSYVENFRKAYCQICFTYYCSLHFMKLYEFDDYENNDISLHSRYIDRLIPQAKEKREKKFSEVSTIKKNKINFSKENTIDIDSDIELNEKNIFSINFNKKISDDFTSNRINNRERIKKINLKDKNFETNNISSNNSKNNIIKSLYNAENYSCEKSNLFIENDEIINDENVSFYFNNQIKDNINNNKYHNPLGFLSLVCKKNILIKEEKLIELFFKNSNFETINNKLTEINFIHKNVNKINEEKSNLFLFEKFISYLINEDLNIFKSLSLIYNNSCFINKYFFNNKYSCFIINFLLKKLNTNYSFYSSIIQKYIEKKQNYLNAENTQLNNENTYLYKKNKTISENNFKQNDFNNPFSKINSKYNDEKNKFFKYNNFPNEIEKCNPNKISCPIDFNLNKIKNIYKKDFNNKNIISKENQDNFMMENSSEYIQKDSFDNIIENLSNTNKEIKNIPIRKLSELNSQKNNFCFHDNLSTNNIINNNINNINFACNKNNNLNKSNRNNLTYKISQNDYIPCDHDGKCTTENCDCIKIRGACEKFCICYKSCKSSYQGCNCQDSCGFSCPCVLNMRECDPDICSNCLNLPYNLNLEEYKELNKYKISNCLNCSMFEEKYKKIRISNSLITDSYGLFILEDVQKDEFICEYKGELLTREETDRRSVFNDQMGLNYFFKLNEFCDIDAYRVGNEMRYFNFKFKFFIGL